MSLHPVLLLLLRVCDAVVVCFPCDVSGESGYSEQRDDHEQQSGRLGSPAGVAELPPRHSHAEEGRDMLEHGELLFSVNTTKILSHCT